MDRPSFAQALRTARKEAGLSQAALADKAGLTAPYISLIESGRRRPPTAPLIERLAKALGVKPEALADLAALERTPSAIRKRLEGLDRERGKVHRTRDRILSTTLFNLAQRPDVLAELEATGDEALWFRGVLGRLGGKLRGVSTAREARTRSAELLDPLPSADRDRLMEALPDMLGGAPSGMIGLAGAENAAVAGSTAAARDAAGGVRAQTLAETPALTTPVTTERPASVRLEVRLSLSAGAVAEETLYVDGRWAAQGAFLWRLSSDEAYPRFEAGDLLLVEPARAPTEGDLVALRHDGRDLLRVFRRRAGEVRLEALRAELAPLRLNAAAFAPVGVVTRVLRSLT